MRNRNTMRDIKTLKNNSAHSAGIIGFQFSLDDPTMFNPYDIEHVRTAGFKARLRGGFVEIEDDKAYEIYLQSLKETNSFHPANIEHKPQVPIFSDNDFPAIK